jgi:hypothetical protein
MKQITLATETADRITVDTLQDYIRLLKAEVKRLEKKFPIADHTALDIRDCKQTIEAMKTTLKYFGGV